jgi:hypothetical protein
MKKKNQNRLLSHLHTSFCALAITGVSLVWASLPASAATFVETVSEPFGTFGDVEYIRYTGRFVESAKKILVFENFYQLPPATQGEGSEVKTIKLNLNLKGSS